MLREQEAGQGRVREKEGRPPTGGVCRHLGWGLRRTAGPHRRRFTQGFNIRSIHCGRRQELTVGTPPAGEPTGLMPSAGIGAHPVWLRIESAAFLHQLGGHGPTRLDLERGC